MRNKGINIMTKRRTFILSAAALAACSRTPTTAAAVQTEDVPAEDDVKNPAPSTIPDYDKWQLSEAEWKERLTPQQFAVLRREATERAFTSDLNDEKREGVYACAGCGFDLFRSSEKYESGTGWPSFFDVIPNAIGTKTDYKILYPRTEYHCARCGGHQGHVFKDGPAPTGLRYCNNGVALVFKPSENA